MAHISLNSALFWATLGDGEAVVEHGRDMTKLGTELEAVLWTTLGGIYEQVGELIAQPTHERAMAVSGLAAAFEGISGSLPMMLYVYAAQGALATGDTGLTVNALDAVARLSGQHALQHYDAEASRLRAATLRGADRTATLTGAADLARRQGARRYRLKALIDLVEHDPVAAVTGATATEALRDAVAQMPEREFDPDVGRATAALANAVQ
jgi:hypothetical protein